VFEIGPGAAARGFGHASRKTVGHEVGELVDGEEPCFGDLVVIEVEAVNVGLIQGATAEDCEEFVALCRVRCPIEDEVLIRGARAMNAQFDRGAR
jgi:hypothetical protein